MDRFLINTNFPFIRLIQPVENFHKSAFTGPILTEKGMDFSCTNIEIDAVIGNNPREPLDNPLHLYGIDLYHVRHFQNAFNPSEVKAKMSEDILALVRLFNIDLDLPFLHILLRLSKEGLLRALLRFPTESLLKDTSVYDHPNAVIRII